MSDSILEVTGTTLAGIELFTDLDQSSRQNISNLCTGQRYKAGDLIVSHHDNTRDVFFIVSGTVRVTIYSRTGKEITFRDMTSGQMFGELSAIDGKPRSAHVIALNDSNIAFITPDDFWEALRSYPDVAEKTLKYLANLIRSLSDRVVEISTLGVRNRIHAELLRLGIKDVKDDGTAIISPVPTHSEIASRVSTHREAVTRELSMLASEGIIKKTEGALIISDMAKLQKIVENVFK